MDTQQQSDTATTRPDTPAQFEQVQHVTDGQHISTVKKPIHDTPVELAAKMHAPYPKKPAIQELHETLTDETPTGYRAHREDERVPKSGEEMAADGQGTRDDGVGAENPNAQPAQAADTAAQPADTGMGFPGDITSEGDPNATEPHKSVDQG